VVSDNKGEGGRRGYFPLLRGRRRGFPTTERREEEEAISRCNGEEEGTRCR
jgi:hypothetical protein